LLIERVLTLFVFFKIFAFSKSVIVINSNKQCNYRMTKHRFAFAIA